ncbi:DnaJ-like proiein [Sarotherodon galilaeus]
MLKLIMVLLWMILLVLLLCAEAENVTKVRGELGTNVTLTCSNQTTEIHWYMEIHSQFRACIGRRFSSADSTYCSPGFETKFSILGNKLVIKNFRAEDCRLYFCGIRRDGSIQFVETFHLISGLSCVSLSLKRRISKYQANLPPAGTSERLEIPQYEEIQLPRR